MPKIDPRTVEAVKAKMFAPMPVARYTTRTSTPPGTGRPAPSSRPARNSPVEIALPCGCPGDRRQRRSLAAAVAPLPGKPQRPIGFGACVLELAQDDVEIRAREVGVHHDARIDGVAELPGGPQRLVVERDRLPVGERRGRLARRLHQVLQCPVPYPRVQEVVREDLVLFGDPVPVQIFDRKADAPVECM